jgi:hypothetical protein
MIMAKSTPSKPLTKTQLLASIAATARVPKEQVTTVLDALTAEIRDSLGKDEAGVITIPELVRIEKKPLCVKPGP